VNALSIRQPWAWLIAHGYKDIENRKWRTGFRGRFLIHAGLQVDRLAYTVFRDFYDLPEIDDLPTGGIVGSADLKECVDQHPLPPGKYQPPRPQKPQPQSAAPPMSEPERNPRTRP